MVALKPEVEVQPGRKVSTLQDSPVVLLKPEVELHPQRKPVLLSNPEVEQTGAGVGVGGTITGAVPQNSPVVAL